MKRLLFAFTGIFALLLGSCSSEIGKYPAPDPIPVGILRAQVELEGLTSQMVKTRVDVDAETGEDKIKSLYLLFFEAESDRNGEFVDYVEIENPTSVSSVYDINMSDKQLEVTDPYHILAIANIKGAENKEYLGGMDVSAWMLQWAGKTEQDVIDDAFAWTRTGIKIEPDALLMSGRVEKARNQFEVTVPLSRNQVRFDVLANDVGEDYSLVSVEIRNAYPSSKIWSDGLSDGDRYSDDVGRIPQYYGLNEAQIGTVSVENGVIHGHLYAFANTVTMPVQNDKLTTCLIVGLRKIADGSVSYYRVNIAPDESAQMLKRNNAYRLTINSVGGDGDTSAEDAYNNAKSTDLDYTINTWNIPNTGVMVQDGNSLLSSPYKTINLPRAEIREENSNTIESNAYTSFQIFTFTNKSVVDKDLEILEQSYTISDNSANPYPLNKIKADILPGNILSISAAPIASGLIVKGTIKLGYMGLRATINVVQTDLVTDFMQVHLPDGGIPRFAPFGGIQSGLLRVEASDEWTAEIFAPDGGFSFSGTGPKTVLDPTVSGDAAFLTDGNKFRVWTRDANSLQSIREAFIVVSLKKDPENYAQVIRVAQDVTAEIAIVPKNTIIFNGMGDLAQIPGNVESNVFIVRPSQIGDPATLAKWEYKITPARFEEFFTVTQTESTDPDTPDLNTLTVTVNRGGPLGGKNTSGGDYVAKLTVNLYGNDAVSTSIDIIQHSVGIELAPNTVPAVPKTGGESQAIAIQADKSLKWELVSFTTEGTGGAAYPLAHHDAELLLEDGTPVTSGTQYSVETQKFKVRFPKIYYPNRDKNISATVTVKIVGSTLSKSITVRQTPLTAAPMVGYGMTGSPAYGGLTNTYNRGWDGEGPSNGGVGLAQIPGYKRLGIGTPTTGAINATVNYLHVIPHISGTANQNSYSWSVINNYIETRDALTVIVSQDQNGVVPVNKGSVGTTDMNASPLRRAGYGPSEYGRDENGFVYQEAKTVDSKVYKFLFDHGHRVLDPSEITQYFYIDGVNTSLDISEIPDSGVALIRKEGGHVNRAVLVVDIAHKFIWMGESQIFWDAGWLDRGQGLLLDNLMYFIANASKYGSHFTDMLLEAGIDLGDGRKAQPAPWDATWWGRDVTREMTK